jgi:hypothetical protein
MPDFYPTPTASPYDDIEQYIGLLLGAIDAELDQDSAWAAEDTEIGRGYAEDLKAYLMLRLVNPVVETLFGDSAPTYTLNTNDPGMIGVRFRATYGGAVRGIRCYRVAEMSNGQIGYLFNTSGDLLATANFPDSGTGWMTATFSTPVEIEPGVNYIAAMFIPNGVSIFTVSFFGSNFTSGNLVAPADTGGAPNGVFAIGAAGTFPTSGSFQINFWVDVKVFTNQARW